MINLVISKDTNEPLSVPTQDLLRGLLGIGSTGTGKTSCAKTIIAQAVDQEQGFGLLDPEGDLYHYALAECARDFDTEGNIGHALNTVLVDPTHGTIFPSLNFLAVPEGVDPYTHVDGLLEAFKKAWKDAWGPRMADFLRHSFILSTELRLSPYELNWIVSFPKYREALANASSDPNIKAYFLEHLKNIRGFEMRSWTEAVRNKIAPLVTNPYLWPCLAQDTCLDFYDIIERNKNLLIFPAQEHLKESAGLFGMIITSLLQQAASRRADNVSKPWLLIIDEFQLFATEALIGLLTRARRRGIATMLFHQSTAQPPFDREKGFIRTVLDATHIKIVFRCGAADAKLLAKEMFEITGEAIKVRARHPIWGSFGPAKFYSTSEQEAHWEWQLQNQAPRECYASIATAGIETHAGYTFDIPGDPVPQEKVEQFTEYSHIISGHAKADAEAAIERRKQRLFDDYGVKPPMEQSAPVEHIDPPSA